MCFKVEVLYKPKVFYKPKQGSDYYSLLAFGRQSNIYASEQMKVSVWNYKYITGLG